jgi:hypothetical protein
MIELTNKLTKNKKRLRRNYEEEVVLAIQDITPVSETAIQDITPVSETAIQDVAHVDQCVICLEFTNNHTNKIIRMRDIHLTTHCFCNSQFHSMCLFNWFMVSSSCPICRQMMIITPNVLKQLNPYYRYTILIAKCKQQIRRFINTCYAVKNATLQILMFCLFIKVFKVIMMELYNYSSKPTCALT